jgi:acyl-CoA synthetase (AMP-forming)/AMP-acid ligase II
MSSVTYTDQGRKPKKSVHKRTITNADGTRTEITTTTITTYTASKEETTKEVDTKHFPSHPRVRRERVTLDDGTTGWKKTSKVVYPGGQKEITIELPNGEKEVKIEEPDENAAKETSKTPELVIDEPNKEEKEFLSWPKFPWDSLMKRLQQNGQELPNKTAVSFLQCTSDKIPTISSSWNYHQLNSAVEFLAARLLPPVGVDGSNETPLIQIPSDQPPLEKGDRILIVYPPCSPHFLITFLACLRAGLVAVPVYPPHPDRKDSLGAFAGIARECGARVALTNGEYATSKRLGQLKNNFMSKIGKKDGEDADDARWPDNLLWVVTDREALQYPPAQFPKLVETPGPEDIAFLQFTSGSTSAPKGVALTHANLSHNLYVITDELNASKTTKVVSWLPQYHDMGLIGALLGVLYCGGSGYYMSPIAFLQRPMAWMEAVSEYRATHLQAPNFAFGLTARKFEPDGYYNGLGGETTNKDGKKVKPLDLSCLQHVINGAEPVTVNSIKAYEKAFKPFGLRTEPSVIFPTYGLAEHTVFVCSGGQGKLQVKKKDLEQEGKAVIIDDGAVSDTVTLVGCGFPQNQNIDVRIVEPVSRRLLPDDRVGEIWVNSPSKALKYYGKDAKETEEEFHAIIENMKEASIKFGGFLRTGDLGFMHKEQLYVCGRIKDLIIVAGRNHYPQDLEATAESIVSEYVRPGCSAAFSIGSKSGDRGDYEQVVMAMELKGPVPKGDTLTSICESIANKVRSEIFKEHALALESIVLVKPRTIPKTTSGKIQRSKTCAAFINKSLQQLYRRDFDGSEIGLYGDELPSQKDLAKKTKGTQSPITKTPEEIRKLEYKEIKEMLMNSISQIAQVSKNDIKENVALSTFMDSVSLAQFKGLLETSYGVKAFSDEYLFRDTTTVKKLVNVVKAGAAQDDGDGTGVSTKAVGSGGPGCCGCVVM